MTDALFVFDYAPQARAAESVPLTIAAWREWWRVMDGARIVAICETRDEAVAYIARQPDAERIGDGHHGA